MKTRLLTALAFVATLGALAGCSQDNLLGKEDTGGSTAGKDVVITVGTDFDSPSASLTRANISTGEALTRASFNPDGQGGATIEYKTGEQVKVYVVAQQGAKKATLGETTMTIVGKRGDKYHGRFQITVPANSDIDFGKAEPVMIAGAAGVASLDGDGNAVVEWTREVDTSGDQYTMPMYFPLTTVTKDGDRYNGLAHFHLYGSLVGINLTSHLYDPFEPRQLVFQTSAFTSEGKMDLFSTAGGQAPRWTTTQTSDVLRKYNLKQGLVTRDNPVKSFYVWAKPASTTATEQMTLTVRDGAYSLDPKHRSEPVQSRYTVKPMQDGRLYSLNAKVRSDLIITEVYHPGQANSVIELYNPTTHYIRLSDYYLITRPWNKTAAEGHAVRLGKEFGNGVAIAGVNAYVNGDRNNVWFVDYSNESVPSPKKDASGELLLSPGKCCLYAAYGYSDGGLTTAVRPSLELTFRFYGATRTKTEKDNNSQEALFFGTDDVVMIAKGRPDENHVVDALFRLDPNNIPPGNPLKMLIEDYARRPDRNFPHKFMIPSEKDTFSDWMFRTLTGGDLGCRFSWRWENGTVAKLYPSEVPFVYFNGGLASTHVYDVPFFWKKDTWH